MTSNKLTFIEYVGRNKHGMKLAKYLCECGSETITEETSVKRGLTKSCGCAKKEIGQRTKTHGLSKHPLYSIYYGIKDRCYDPTSINYCRYGAIGARMCEEWLNDFVSFYNWCISNGWEKGMNVDKDLKSNSLLYSPQTCTILTPKQNSNATKSNKIINYQGISYTVSQLADKIGISYNFLRGRIAKGLSIEDAINLRPFYQRKPIICLNTGIRYDSIKKAAEKLGLRASSISRNVIGEIKSTKGYKFEYLTTQNFEIKHMFGFIK